MSASEPASSQASEDLRSSSQLGGSHSQVTASTQRVTQPSSSACSSSNDEASGAVSTSAQSDDGELPSEDFVRCCRELSMSEECKAKAWEFVLKMRGEAPPPDDRGQTSRWHSCAMFVAIKMNKLQQFGGAEPSRHTAIGLLLDKLLSVTGTKAKIFFEDLRVFIDSFHLDKMFDLSLKAMQTQFLTGDALCRKYADLLFSIFTDSTEDSMRPVAMFGWVLFLILKGKVLQHLDLYNSYLLLICVCNLMLHNRPASFRHDAAFSEPGSNQLLGDTLKVLATATERIPHELSQMNERMVVVLRELCSTGLLKGTAIDSGGTLLISGLLADHITENSAKATTSYEEMLVDRDDLDERMFFDDACNSKRQISFSSIGDSPQRVPLRVLQHTPSTPMTRALHAVNWLAQEFGDMSLPLQMPEDLQRLCKNCVKDPAANIQARASTLTSKIDSRSHEELGGVSLRKPGDYAMALYYRVLCNMLVSEEARLKVSDFTGLLHNDKFHKSLLAVCLEVLTFSYGYTDFRFPKVLQICNLQSFEFQKVIESFIKHEKQLPSTIKKHLTDIEERVLESMAWTGDSVLLECLQNRNTEQAVARLFDRDLLPDDGDSPVSPMASPSANGLPPRTPERANGRGVFPPKTPERAAPTTPGGRPASQLPPMTPIKGNINMPEGQSVASASVTLFFRKMKVLVYKRLHEICSVLELNPKVKPQVWTVMMTILSKEELRKLLVGRHLDQLLLCALYAICKIHRLDVKFRQILEEYRKQPQASPKIYRQVLSSGDDSMQRTDIITFYNQVFVPKVKHIVVQFSATVQRDNGPPSSPTRTSSREERTPPSTPPHATTAAVRPDLSPAPMPTAVPMSPGGEAQRVALSKVYVSPMKPRRCTLSAMTPRTSKLYAFGESPSRDLREFNNNMMRDVRAARRPMDDEADSQPPQQRRRLDSSALSTLTSVAEVAREEYTSNGSEPVPTRSSVRTRHPQVPPSLP